jgi:hypothetical protein
MNCQECYGYIDAYIDNELDIASTILTKQHLRDCFGCQQLLEARKAVGALSGFNLLFRFLDPR